ncbi:unnamed protein product [Cylicocyclus nassatus]|uniref:Uncharacterized protein n=1 Tax=Cylicocyclus nassatus TaxID=53992 RepID=A0AA36DR24_CYLNA|nr:unnamed protein product [Cylicocyclus nassatus]
MTEFQELLESGILSHYSGRNKTTNETSTKHKTYVTVNSKTDPLPGDPIIFTSGTYKNVSEVEKDIIETLDDQCNESVKIVGVEWCYPFCLGGYNDVQCLIFTTEECPERPEELHEEEEKNDSQKGQREHHEGQGEDRQQEQVQEIAPTAQELQQREELQGDGEQDAQQIENEDEESSHRSTRCPLDIGCA